MSQLKINPDLFLGSQELNRFKKFLDDDGFRKLFLQDSLKFGIFNISKDGNFDTFRVEQGTNVGTIKHAAGLAVDKFGNIITKAATDNISVPNDNAWYWIKIKHQFSSFELGTVSIDLNGNLTGTGTEFLTTLRGSPNNPVKVKFSGSVSNTSEYLVSEVINDTSALLSGDFIAESGLQLIVVGAFTPDVVPPAGSKDIYKYDGCLMTFVAESVLNTAPALLADEEFFVSRVKRNGGTLSIQDKRYDTYKSKTENLLTRIGAATIPLIGVEAIKFNNIRTPRNENVIYLAWGMRSTNWTTDPNTNRLTIIAGQGGKFKDTTYFTDNDFNGWRVYAKNGTGATSFSSYGIVKTSTKSGTQINLTLDFLDPTLFEDTAQELLIVPDADSIEIIFNAHPADATELTSQSFNFKINESFVRIPASVYKSTSCSYNIQYRLNTFGDYRKPVALPTDSVGFLNETSFDVNGVLTVASRTPYTTHATNGFITLTEAPNAYANRFASVETGDLFGVHYFELNNSAPVTTLEVGISKQYQNLITIPIVDGGLGRPYTLTVDHFINIKSTSSVGIKAGNSFIIRFNTSNYGVTPDAQYTFGVFKIVITQDYINSGSTGTHLYDFLDSDFQALLDAPLEFKCVFDGTKWVISRANYVKGRIVLDAGPTDNARMEIGSKQANSTPFIDFNSHGAAPSDYDTRVIASGGTGSAGGGTLNILCAAFQINGVAVTAGSTVSTSRNLIAGNGLSGGGDLSADRTFTVNTDGVTIEISSDALRVVAGGIDNSKLANSAVDASKLATDAVTNTKIQDGAVTTTKIGDSQVTTVKIAANAVDNTKLAVGAAVANIGFTPATAARNLTAGSGLSGGGDLSSDRIFDVNVDNSTIEISSDTLRVKDGGIAGIKLAAGAAAANLGFSAARWSAGSDHNSFIEPGFYYAGATNSPATGATAYFLMVAKDSDSDPIVQISMPLNVSGVGALYLRQFTGGSWGAWSLVNNP